MDLEEMANASRFFVSAAPYVRTGGQLADEIPTVGWSKRPAQPTDAVNYTVFELHEIHRVVPVTGQADTTVLEIREPGGFTHGPSYWPLKTYEEKKGALVHTTRRLLQNQATLEVSLAYGDPCGSQLSDSQLRDQVASGVLRPLATKWVRPLLSAEGRLVHRRAAADSRIGMKVVTSAEMNARPPAVFQLPHVIASPDMCGYLDFAIRFHTEVLQRIADEVYGPKVVLNTCSILKGDGWGEEGGLADTDYKLMLAKRGEIGLTKDEARRLYQLISLPLGHQPHREFMQRYVGVDQSHSLYRIDYRGSQSGPWNHAPEECKSRWTFALLARCWEPDLIQESLLTTATATAVLPSVVAAIVAHYVVDDQTWAEAFRKHISQS